MAAERCGIAAWEAIQNGPWQSLLLGNGASIALLTSLGTPHYTESLKLESCCQQHRRCLASCRLGGFPLPTA